MGMVFNLVLCTVKEKGDKKGDLAAWICTSVCAQEDAGTVIHASWQMKRGFVFWKGLPVMDKQ